ncbi:MAG: SDR family NAD(P)-dependent oxidoreductase [Anaerolineales bacterium]|nr:SDR family NAD(P)-dependent oxidoreductase [Anaerolineales bacterium]
MTDFTPDLSQGEEMDDALTGIAIIGMAGRFPGAKNLDEFWQNLRDGVESISFFSDEELAASGIGPEVLNASNYVKARAVLDKAEWFDASFFEISPREAEIIDPQHRLFLECAWETLENAGYDPDTYQGAIGVYAGTSMNTYLLYNLASNPELLAMIGDYQTMLGNDKDFLTTRVSYKLNLKGPSINVQTACSTSLVAVALACQSLLSYECDMALAGGVSVMFPQRQGYFYQEGGIHSPDGRCRAFDSQAQGMFAGQGTGIVALKRLEDATADGDHIYAVIKGVAVNNDGSLKVGYTAPSVEGQAAVISMAQALAGVEPETISYIEAHGTATPLGDPIEIAGLTQAFRAGTDAKEFCAVGSVKTNIGHLDAAAGVAGLIKTTMALEHKQIPPSLHFEQPNPKIDFANSPFYVNTSLTQWPAGDTPRRAGVSSFGIGGTNAHVVLEEAPPATSSESARERYLLPLSAKTDLALQMATENLAAYLKKNPTINLADVAYTLQLGRRAFDYRRIVVCSDVEDAVKALQSVEPGRVLTSFYEPAAKTSPVVFMFPGQGAQYIDMGLELYQAELAFREQVDFCAEFLKPHLGLDLRDLLYPTRNSGAELTEAQAEAVAEQLRQTNITQPALFVIEYALARLWMAWGIQPQAMIGHSIGEYVAACLAGVFTLEEALSVVVARGRLMQQMPAGAMLAVPLPEEQVTPLLNGGLSLAVINGPALCVVAGPMEAVDAFQTRLAAQEVDYRRLHTSHAFHSSMMTPAADLFAAQLNKIELKPPQIPFLSNVSGTWITASEATNPAYWASHLRETVRFSAGLGELLKEQDRVLLEVGPGRTLSSLVKQHPHKSREQVVLTSLRHPQERSSDVEFLLTTLGRLWLSGVKVDWLKLYVEEERQRVPLPTYPFERQRYWIEPRGRTYEAKPEPRVLAKKSDMADWFYEPVWKQQALTSASPETALASQKLTWLLFLDNGQVGLTVLDQLSQADQAVITVRIGQTFEQITAGDYTINPQVGADYERLLAELKALNQLPDKMVHFWSVTSDNETSSASGWDEAAQNLGFYSLLYLTQALGSQQITRPSELEVISTQLHNVRGDEALSPAKATILGLCRVIPQEYHHIRCRNIDLVLPAAGQQPPQTLIDSLLAELVTESVEPVVAYRDIERWIQTFDPMRLEGSPASLAGLRDEGVYLITGGLGGIGLALAEYLAQTVKAKLILTARTPLPDRTEWARWLETHDDQDPISRKINQVRALEEAGAKVLVLSADVADLPQMEAVITQTYQRFGQLNGVIHAAGVVKMTPLQEMSRTECEPQFQSKGRGLVVLERVLQDKAIDFCLLTSSLASILGGVGYGAYAAANLFIDAFVQKHNRISDKPWISVNWDGWRFTDLAEKSLANVSALAEMRLTPTEGIETFTRILAASMGSGRQVVVSTGDLEARINQWVKQVAARSDRASATRTQGLSSQARSGLQSTYVAPRNEIEQKIADIWQELLGVEQIGIHDDFFDLGGNSLLALRIFAQIEKVLGKKLPLATLMEATTVAKLAAIMGGDMAPSVSWSSLVPIQPNGSKPPLFCVHAAGGNVLLYRDLTRYLGPDQPVYGLQSQGLDGSEPLLTTVEDMAALYLKEIKTVQPEGPYLLGGYCMGGTVALEMAQQLEAEGQKVAMLALFETYNWSKMTVRSFSEAVYWIQKAGFQFRNFFQLDTKGKWVFLTEKAKVVKHRGRVWYGLIRSRFDSNYFERSGHNIRPSQLWEINDRAVLYYSPKVYTGQITHFCPIQEYSRHQGPEVGWDNLTTVGVDTQTIPVYPGGMLVEPFVEQTAKVLNDCIDKALEQDHQPTLPIQVKS